MLSSTLLYILTVVEIVVLVLVLAYFLIRIASQLRDIASLLAEVAFGVRAVERMLNTIRTVHEINDILDDIVRVVPGVAAKAESLAAERRGAAGAAERTSIRR